jgi:hypothetical protein
MSQPKYLPFADGQWRMNLGLKALNLQEWIEIDEHFAEELALKDKGKQGWDTTINAENAGKKLWLRVERQTLRRLRISGDILFTIRTYVHPLYVLEGAPAMAHNLAVAVEQVPPDMQSYKNLRPIRDSLLRYLEQVTAACSV